MMNVSNQGDNKSFEEATRCCRQLDVFFSKADGDVILLSDTIVCVINSVFSVIAVFANILILHALFKASSLHPPSKALLCSLALSDLGVGAIVQPLFVVYRWAQIKGILHEYCTEGIFAHIEGSYFSAVSSLTMTAISIDRLLSLVLRVQYQSIVTLRRVLFLLALIWIIGGVWSSTWTRKQDMYSLVGMIYIPVFFAITFCAYLKIYLCLRKQACRMGRHVNPLKCIRKTHGMNFARYKKSVVSMFYLFCASVVSFLPYLCHKVAVAVSGWNTSTSVLFSFALTMVYLNSSANPLIYCWRISELKQIVLNVLCRNRSAVKEVKFVTSKEQVKILA